MHLMSNNRAEPVDWEFSITSKEYTHHGFEINKHPYMYNEHVHPLRGED